MLSGLLIILGLMVLNGVFAGAEIAVLSVRKTRLAELVEEKARGARAVEWLRHEPERFLATVQIGITVVGTTAAALGGEQLAGEFGHWLAAHAPWLGRHATRIGLVAVVLLISFLEIVVGELVPKSLALRSAERYSLVMGPALRGMASVVKPAVWLLTRVSNAVLRLFGDKTSFTETRLSPEELQELVEEAARVGSIDAKTSEIASRALEFRDLRAVDVMVPRREIVGIAKDATTEALKELLAKRRYARVPVYEGTPENVVGYLTLRDLLPLALVGRVSLGDAVRPVKFVPATVPASDLLKQLQSERAPLTMVVDEIGSVVGMVTIEDLVEELVGEILSEREAPRAALARAADGSVVVPGTMPIREINRALDIELPEPEGFTTIAGLCLSLAERIPEPGATLTTEDGTVLEVLDASARRVRQVRIRPPPAPRDSAAPAP